MRSRTKRPSGGPRWLAAIASLLGLLPLGLAARAAAIPASEPCPAPESLVPGTIWQTHQLAPGVQLYDGSTTDDGGQGRVKMHVLRVDLTTPGISIQPLMRAVAQRTPLSQLAANDKQLVAAINTGYFDFVTGAPTQPLIIGGKPLVMSARPERVVGFDAAGRMQWGTVSLSAQVSAYSQEHRLNGLNSVDTGGVVLFQAPWGNTVVPTGPSSVARTVTGTTVTGAASRDTQPAAVPANGYELVSHGLANDWLSQLAPGTRVRLTDTIVTTAPHPFAQAYGVGPVIVDDGIARTGLPCDTAGTNQPAQTAIAVANDGTLVIGEIEEHPGTNLHGLDADQMGQFMAELGVSHAWLLDGSGSTEMLARMPGAPTLTLHTYPADGAERPMPVGIGIGYRKPASKRG
jgi:hypothetical protein